MDVKGRSGVEGAEWLGRDRKCRNVVVRNGVVRKGMVWNSTNSRL